MTERIALRVEDAAELLDISRSLAYELVRDGRLPSIRVGNAIRIPRRALEAWIDEQTRQRRGA